MTTTRPPYQWELAFPTTGPRIRDHLQARIVEELLRVALGRSELAPALRLSDKEIRARIDGAIDWQAAVVHPPHQPRPAVR